jgi:hypothetical protein
MNIRQPEQCRSKDKWSELRSARKGSTVQGTEFRTENMNVDSLVYVVEIV